MAGGREGLTVKGKIGSGPEASSFYTPGLHFFLVFLRCWAQRLLVSKCSGRAGLSARGCTVGCFFCYLFAFSAYAGDVPIAQEVVFALCYFWAEIPRIQEELCPATHGVRPFEPPRYLHRVLCMGISL